MAVGEEVAWAAEAKAVVAWEAAGVEAEASEEGGAEAVAKGKAGESGRQRVAVDLGAVGAKVAEALEEVQVAVVWVAVASGVEAKAVAAMEVEAE